MIHVSKVMYFQVGAWDSKEIDFAVNMPMGDKEYYQVCLGFYDKTTEERELSSLRLLEDNFPKTLLMLNAWTKSTTSDGIIVRNIVDWLMGRN